MPRLSAPARRACAACPVRSRRRRFAQPPTWNHGDMTGTSRVTFLRPRLGYRDWLRAYRLFIDDAPHGKIKRGQEVSVDITPGPHEVEARIDWTGSPRLAFTASPGAVSTDTPLSG